MCAESSYISYMYKISSFIIFFCFKCSIVLFITTCCCVPSFEFYSQDFYVWSKNLIQTIFWLIDFLPLHNLQVKYCMGQLGIALHNNFIMGFKEDCVCITEWLPRYFKFEFYRERGICYWQTFNFSSFSVISDAF